MLTIIMYLVKGSKLCVRKLQIKKLKKAIDDNMTSVKVSTQIQMMQLKDSK